MYRIDQMELVGVDGEAGLCISWIPSGLLIEMAQNKLDTLRIQYEHQISSLQRQLEAERRNTQEQMEQRKQEYVQLVSDLRATLDQEQQEALDKAISELTKLQSAEIEIINAIYQHDLSLELTALKLSMEQIYMSKLQLEMSDLKMRYDQRLDALNKQHKEEINILTARSNNIESSISISSSLTDQYNFLIQQISAQFEKMLPVGQEKVDHLKHSDGGVVNGEEDQEVPSIHFAQDLHNLLLNQQEEIQFLRSKLLSEYESLLQQRTEVMQNQSSQVSALEEQILQLEKQYGEELRSKQETILCRNGEHSEESDPLREKWELQLEELRSYYEAKLEHMRSTYEKEMNFIKEKYEQQVADLICNTSNEPGNDNNAISVSSSDHHKDKSTKIAEASDRDIDTKDVQDSAQTELSVCLKKLESELADKDVQCKELMAKLKSEEFRSRSLDVDVANLRKEVDDLQQKSSEALSQCSHLQDLLLEKDTIIGQLELEKGESEKLYRDLLEKESSSARSIVIRDHLSGTDGDDSFISAIDVFKETPSDVFKSPDHRTSAAAIHEENMDNNVYDLETSLPHISMSLEHATGNINNNSNSNNNYSNSALASLEGLVENLKKHIEELDHQLADAKEREAKLQVQIEEKEYTYKEMIESIRLELEHERQMEVESLQSEFKVQMEIELKRQAAELAMSQSTEQTSPVRTESELQNAEISPSAEVVSQSDNQLRSATHSGEQTPPVQTESESKSTEIPSVQTESESQSTETPFASEVVSQSDNQQSAISDVFNMQKLIQEESPLITRDNVADSVNEHHDTSQKRPEFYLQQATLEAALAPSDTAEITIGSHISEHITEQPTSTVSSLLCHDRSESVPISTHALVKTDLQHQVTQIEKEYEGKIAALKEQIEQLNVERALLISNYQEEIEKIRQQLNESEDKYEHLLEDVQSGEQKEVYQLLKDKYDEELEIAKSIMQKDFDQTLSEEKKMFVEKHRQLMDGFMEDGERREQEAEERHIEELQTLNRKFEQTIEGYEQEIERLNHDMKLLRDARFEETDEATSTMKSDRTLPEIDEITFSFQEVDAKPDSSDSPRSQETSTEVGHHYSDVNGAVYHGSDDETDANTISTMQIRTFAEVVKTPAPLSVHERQQFEMKIQQLVAEVERLRQQLREAENRESMACENSLPYLSNTDTQTGDDPSVIAMLRSDIERISAERESVLRTNGRLLSLLSENVKTYIGVEDTINHRLSEVVSSTRSPAGHPSDEMDSQELSQDSLDLPGAVGFTAHESLEGRGAAPEGDTSRDSHGFENTSLLSNATDEGLEVSQRLAESIFVGPDLDAEGEEILTDARGRLQSAVGQLLELMELSTVQLMEAKATQQELLDSLASRGQELELTKIRCSELDGQLATEIEAKEYLVLELHKAEGLISGYSTERESMESQIQSLEDQREVLIVELDTTRASLQELQPSQSQPESSNGPSQQQQLPGQHTSREIQAKTQQNSGALDDSPQVLLEEIANLSEDKKELSSQLQYQIEQLHKQLVDQESAAEESERRHEAAIEERNQAVEDLKLQLENVEKLLKANKAFVEEQMSEREQEREEHQQEIERLEQLLEGKDRSVSSQQRLQLEISDLTEQLQARVASQSTMHQRILDLQKSLEDKELSAHDLKAWVSQLECELDQRGSVEEQLKQRINKLEKQLTEKSEESDSTEQDASNSLASTQEKGSSPLQLSPAKQTHWASSVSLKEELERVQPIEETSKPTQEGIGLLQELKHENVVLKEQLQQQLLQISGLRNQLDHLRHYGGNHEDSDASQLRLKLQAERDKVEILEEKLSDAQNKLDSFEHILQTKEEEAEDVKTKVSQMLEMGDAHEENESLKGQLKVLQAHVSHLSSQSSLQALPPELLDEKNLEIEELKQKLQLAETELSQMIQEEALHKDSICELQTRLKEKDEEIGDLQDSINSLRRGEPCLDVSLPLNEDTGNMLNISMTGRTSIQQELEESIADKEKSVYSLQQELEETRKSLEAQEHNVKKLSDLVVTLQKQNEDACADKEMSVKHLEEIVNLKDKELYDLTLMMQELQQQVEEHVKVQEHIEKDLEAKESELTEVIEDRDKSQEQLHEKEDKLEQMILQIDSLQQEISSLTSFQHELQKDFDTVQSMLEDKEKELENIAKEYSDNKLHQDTLHEILHLEKLVASLRKDLVEKQYVVDEKEEELYELHDKLEEMGNIKEELRSTQLKLNEITEQFQKEQKLRLQLEDQLAKEKVAEADMTLVESTEDSKENTDISSQKEAENFINNQEVKISLLEQELLELKSKAESDAKLWEEMMTTTQHSAEQINSEENKILANEIESLKLQIKEKDVLILSLQADLKEATSDEQIIKNTTSQLECQDKEEAQFSNSKEVVNSAVQQHVDEVGELKSQIEIKEMSIAELEGQLRFRQSSILSLAEEKEKILEEKQEMEADFQQQLQRMDKMLSDLQKKYDDLKKGISEEVLQMEQDIDRSSQAQLIKQSESEKEVDELKRKIIYAADELTDMSNKHKQAEERCSQVSQQLAEREEQIQHLQNEIQNIQLANDQPDAGSAEKDMMIEKLEHQLREANDIAAKEALTAAESTEIIAKLESEVRDLKETNNSRENSFSLRSVDMSASLPLQGIRFAGEGTGMSRWDSAPAVLNLSNRESMYIHYSVNEAERLAHHQRKELSEKNRELDKLRQDLERWLKMGKGQDSMQLIIKEKDERIITYQTEIESIKSVLKEKEHTISSLRNQIQSLQASHYEALSSKDHIITELEKQMYILKSTSKSGASSPSRSSTSPGESLSPETKQSISHLKMQLRKAHAALEEMQHSQVEEFEVGGGDADRLHKTSVEKELEELKQTLRVREEELSSLKVKFDKEIESRIQALSVQHEHDIMQQKQQQEQKLEQLLSRQKQDLELQHQAQLNELTLQNKPEVHASGQLQDHQTTNQSTEIWENYNLTSSDDDMPERLKALLHHLNQLGEHLLSVSDMHFLQKHLTSARHRDSSAETAAWEEERKGLLDNIAALKSLLKQADQVGNLENDHKLGDWRVGLLHALAAVYEKEQQVLQVEVNISRSLYPDMDLFAQLETKVHNLEQIHQSGLDEMLKADRQSLIDEINNLHQRLLEANSQLQENQDQVRQQVVRLEEVKSSTEWKLQRQIQMLEYKLQQESVVQEDMKKSLRLERQRVSELSSQSSQDRSRILELQSELSVTQINLSKVRDALEREQQRFHSVTDALEEERAKTIRLAELLEATKRKFQTFQEEVNHTDVRYQQKVHSEEDYIKELQETLVKERERSIQFSEAEELAKREIVRLTDENDILNRKLSLLQDEHKAEVDMLRTESMGKKLQTQLEDNSEAAVKLTALLESERDSHQAAIQHEEKLAKQLRQDVDQLRSENSQLKRLYETERSHADTLKSDIERARTELIESRKNGDTPRTHSTNQNHLHSAEKHREELIDRVRELEVELARVQDRASELEKELETARSQSHHILSTKSNHVSHSETRTLTMAPVDEELRSRLSHCCSKLQMLASQLHEMTTNSRQHRGSSGHDDAEGSDVLVTIMSELREIRSEIKKKEETVHTVEAEGSASSSSAEVLKLREHNQQLAEHIVKINKEKEKLTDTLKNLEKRLHLTVKRDPQAQVNIPQYISDTASEEDTVYDRTIWASERLSLQMALNSAEHEIQRLRSEIQNFKSSVIVNGHGTHTDPDKASRLYGKYLRAESFRKALIYQKKYLLLLLGGYRDTEQETLAILASMGGYPSSYAGMSSRRKHSRAIMMFRSAGRVVIAVFRMKYLVKKWKRATRVGSPVVTGQINHQHAYIPSNAAYLDHQRHFQEPYSLQQHSPSANTRTARSSSSSSNNVDHFSSLSNEVVSPLNSEAYQGAAASRVRPYRYTTPPTKDLVSQLKSNSRGKSEESRRRIFHDEDAAYSRYTPSARPLHTENDDDGFLQYLENVQQELSEGNYSTPSLSSARRVTWR